MSDKDKILSELIARVNRCKEYVKQFGELVSKYKNLFEKCKTMNVDDFAVWIKDWFSSFLGFRDEVMILIKGKSKLSMIKLYKEEILKILKGEVRRDYHVKDHAPFKHSRNKKTATGTEGN
jgi:hypothetical protein